MSISYSVNNMSPNEIGAREKMIAACSGSLLTSVVVNPFDVVRVRMQQDSAYASANRKPTQLPTGKFPAPKSLPRSLHGSSPIPAGIGTAICCRDVFWYPSTIDYCVASQLVDSCTLRDHRPPTTFGLLSSIVRDEGFSALWRGLSMQLIQSIPSNVVYFVCYEAMRDNSPIKEWPTLNPLVCGGLARAFATTSVSPLELFKTRLQSVRGPDAAKICIKSIKDMVKGYGFSSLWSGLSLTLWRDVPFSSLYWVVVEAVRVQFRQGRDIKDLSHQFAFIESMTAGTVGGLVAAVATTPFDVGKTRKQLGHLGTASANMRILPFMLHIVKEEGWQTLFVGVTPRMLKVAPACAIMITSYEMSKRYFAKMCPPELGFST